MNSILNIHFKKLISNDRVITILLVVGAWIFYGIKASSSPFWYDELFSVFWTQYESIEDVRRVSYWDVGPPGFHLVMHYWNSLFGMSEVAVRSLSNMCMTFSFGLLFLFTKRFFNLRTAIIVSVLFITNSFLYYYSNEARCYAFILLLSIISNFIFAKMILDPKWYWAIALGVVNYYLYYTHYVMINIFAIQGLFAILCLRRRLILWYILSFVPFVLLLWSFLPRVIEILKGNVKNNFDKTAWNTVLSYLSGYFNNVYFGVFLLALLVVGIIIYFRSGKDENEKRPDMVFWYLVCSGIGFIVITYLISVFKSPIFLFRYMIPSLPGVFILIAFFISNMRFSKSIYGVMVLVILIFGFGTINLNTYKGMNLKRQMEFARSKVSPKTAIITDNGLAAYYYDINAFKQVNDVRGALLKRGVYEMWDATFLNGFNYWQYDTVIVAVTWGNTNGLLKGRLLKHYPNTKQLVYGWDACQTYIYYR